MTRHPITALAAFTFFLGTYCAPISAQEITGTNLDTSPASVALTWQAAQVVLPKGRAGSDLWVGTVSALPAVSSGRAPLVIVMHGSSGLAAFVKDYQLWLAGSLGLASIAPDSMALPDRLKYKSPIAKDVYEKVHALRLAELENAIAKARALPWVDPARIAIMGTSEGSVPVARYAGAEPAVRLIYAWSCETNYFVEAHRTAIPRTTPTLNVISARDPFFSPANPWNRDVALRGHCGDALAEHPNALVIVFPSDKHTIINEAAIRDHARLFMMRALGL
jgi:dienelactone hydrolase